MQDNIPVVDVETLEDWILSRIAEFSGLPQDEIDPSEPLSRYGLDSALALTMVGELETKLNTELPSTLLWDYPTVKSLASHLAQL